MAKRKKEIDISLELEQIKCTVNVKTWEKFLLEVADIIVDESSELPEVVGGRIKRLVDRKIEELER